MEKFPTYVKGDFQGLTADLKYFLEGEDDFYDLAKVDAFTRKWRKRTVGSMKDFKRYHQKFLELVGRAIRADTIDQKESNRYFWEGLHKTMRRKIEDRLLMEDPRLDVTTPFKMKNVVAAAEAIFNRKRFNQHLISKKNYGSDTESDDEEEDIKPSHHQSDSEESSEADSEDSDTPGEREARRSQPPTPCLNSLTDMNPHPLKPPERTMCPNLQNR